MTRRQKRRFWAVALVFCAVMSAYGGIYTLLTLNDYLVAIMSLAGMAIVIGVLTYMIERLSERLAATDDQSDGRE